MSHRLLPTCLVLFALVISTSWSETRTEEPTQEKEPPIPDSGPVAGQGIMVGEVSASSAHVQVRLTKTDFLIGRDLPGVEGVVEFTLTKLGGIPDPPRAAQAVRALSNQDFIARASFRNLTPGSRYVCTTRIGSSVENLQPGPVAQFRTHFGAKAAGHVRFVVVTGMNYAKFHGDDRIDQAIHKKDNNVDLPAPYDGPDKALGYPSLATILARKPHFFVGTGDNVYYDTPKEPRAQTVPELRQKWHEQFVQPRYRDLFAVVPTYWMVDDHDYRIDDGDNTGTHLPSPATGRRLMLEQLPVARADNVDAKTYRTYRVSRDLQVWFPENRMYRSPNLMPDGPGKSIWGKEQKAWLMKTLKESDATFKLLISPTPMIGPDDNRKIDNHCDINGFQHERDEFFAWLKKTGTARSFYLMCGDRHWQYHAIHPSGIEEFSCGALVDANSRPGRKSGDPLSTDPKGLIKQPYLQNPRSGGFLEVNSHGAKDNHGPTLTFTWRDERGRVLNEHTKTAPVGH